MAAHYDDFCFIRNRKKYYRDSFNESSTCPSFLKVNTVNIPLPADFIYRITNTLGTAGKQWIAVLPNLIKKTESRFKIKIGAHLPRLSYHYVALAKHANGEAIIVKFGSPTRDWQEEIHTLEFMQGAGVVKIIASEPENRVALLEKLCPGEMLSNLDDDRAATQIAATLMQKIWRPITPMHSFPTTSQWFARLEQPIDLPQNFPYGFIDKAKHIAADLHQEKRPLVLLHGDLHHFNILSAKREPWLAIDPKGVVGEREYEIGAFLRNPIPDIVTTMNTKKILANRVDYFAELLNFDKSRISAWGFAQAVLAAVWALDEKTNDWEIFLKCAEAMN
jgi:streptomycin 6-kinase